MRQVIILCVWTVICQTHISKGVIAELALADKGLKYGREMDNRVMDELTQDSQFDVGTFTQLFVSFCLEEVVELGLSRLHK